jgi:O-antigen/teichoic acid export membrane protein
MPEHIKGIFKNINALAFPKFSENHTTAEIKKTIFKKMGKLLILATAITIVYVVASPYIFRWLFPEYIESIFYSQIFAISIILLPITGLMLTALQAQKAQKELYQFNIYSSITQIVILFFFIYFYGLMGMIVARIVIRFISGAISIALLNKAAAKSTSA